MRTSYKPTRTRSSHRLSGVTGQRQRRSVALFAPPRFAYPRRRLGPLAQQRNADDHRGQSQNRHDLKGITTTASSTIMTRSAADADGGTAGARVAATLIHKTRLRGRYEYV